MSIRARLLNSYLRRVEKRAIARVPDQHGLRRRFEWVSRLSFHAPRGTKRSWETLGGVKALHLTPPGGDRKRVIFYVHGGGFVFGSPNTHAALAATIARRVGAVAVLPRYRLAPEAPFPAATDDILAAYLAVSKTVAPRNIVVGGDSAGGGLALSLLARLCAGEGPKPAGVFAFSPVTDLTFSGQSFAKNAKAEAVLPAARAEEMVAMYLDGLPSDDPRVSPLFDDFAGAPPVWIIAGDTEILLDDTLRMARHLRMQGVAVDETIAGDLPHVWPIFHNMLPEARATLDELAAWIRQAPGWTAEN